jgi:glycosyltransferase involved in cell wall biosynthesis
MYGLSKTLLPLPRSFGIPDVHWIEHWWMISEYGPAGEKAALLWAGIWDGNWGPRICRPLFRWAGRRWEKRFERERIPTRRFPNQPRHVCFVSEYMQTLHREAGLEFPSSEVIYGGVPTEQFYEPVRGPRDPSNPLRLLYAGQISPDRGLHTMVEAIGHMARGLRSRVSLSVAGHNGSRYGMDVKARVQALGLTDSVSFLGRIPHESMPEFYKKHDVLVFPSIREEGLPLTMVEAMLSGCAVVTTGSGGAMEIAALAGLPLFAKNDSLALSQILARLATHREQVPEIASRGQKIALQEFSFERMMRRWSATLERLNGCQR